MQDLTPEEIALWRLLEEAVGPDSLLDFVPRITPAFDRPNHLRDLARAFVRAKNEPVRLCISVPPRHSKTETILHAVAWWLQARPQDTVAYISYAADIAQSKSRRMRDMARRAGVRLRADSKAVHEWRTEEGGGVLATGVGGPLTGQGANLLIVDDPLKNSEEAESPTIRQNLWEWFESTAMTRVEPGGSVIIVHTRWHDDDLIGRLIQAGGWEQINLPAIAYEGTADEAALWPERWSLADLKTKKREVGAYVWASLFQGEPRPRGGRLFREPTRYKHPLITELGSKARIIVGVDPAATDKTTADHSAIVVMACDGKPGTVEFRGDILEVWRGQVQIPELLQRCLHYSRQYGAPLAVESVGGFKAVPQMLRAMDRGARILEVHPMGDKFQRAQPVAAAWNDGRIRVPTSAPWVAPFLAEVCKFTGVADAQDDQVDALSHAFNSLGKYLPGAKPGFQRAPGLVLG